MQDFNSGSRGRRRKRIGHKKDILGHTGQMRDRYHKVRRLKVVN